MDKNDLLMFYTNYLLLQIERNLFSLLHDCQ